MRLTLSVTSLLFIPLFAGILAVSLHGAAWAQTGIQTVSGGTTQSSDNAPLTLTLQDALERAKKINPDYHSAFIYYNILLGSILAWDPLSSRPAYSANIEYIVDLHIV